MNQFHGSRRRESVVEVSSIDYRRITCGHGSSTAEGSSSIIVVLNLNVDAGDLSVDYDHDQQLELL